MKILDYIEEVKDKSLLELPFNEVDALCFGQSSYTLIDEYINDQDILSMNKVGQIYFVNHSDKDIKASKSFVRLAPYVTRALGNSKRFSKAKLHDFVSILDTNNIEQFCAFQVDIDPITTLVVFRGTDDTAIGWREDFEMAYSVVSAQERAKDYVNQRLKPFRNYIYLGHSKGGNLAYYAALHTKTSLKPFVSKIYSFDGPGVNSAFYDSKEHKKIANRYEKFIPEFDIFGTIFDDGSDCKVIKSDAFTIFQHDAMSWEIEDNHFVKALSTTKESNLIKNGLADFISSVSIEQREIFFVELFKALDELNLRNISDISRAGLPAFIRTIKKMMELDDNAKKTGSKLIKIFSDVTSTIINDAIGEAQDMVTNKIEEGTTAIKEFVDERIDYQAIGEAINEAKDVVSNKFEEGTNIIKDFVDDKINYQAISETISETKNIVTNKVDEEVSTIKNFVEDKVGQIKKKL